jgi:predicted DNA-binding transcriptional regulator YafY
MRADRLLSILMILQNRGKVTAQELAVELEVSERTVYRDVIALSTSGVPIYTERGPGGGITLVEEYRSDLTGLTKDEVRALFMLSIPPALSELGLDQELKAAMLKLSASLPSTLRGDQQGVRQRIYIDPTPWKEQQPQTVAPYLLILQRAVWESCVLELRHKSWMRPDLEPSQTRILPYGLVAKAGNWYLIGRREDHVAVLRIDQIVAMQEVEQTFERPQDFDLVRFWQSHCRDEQGNRPVFPVIARIDADLLPSLSWFLGDNFQIQMAGEVPDSMGRINIEIQFEYHEQARDRLLRLGGAIQVLEPIALRYSIKDYAEQILAVYSGKA